MARSSSNSRHHSGVRWRHRADIFVFARHGVDPWSERRAVHAHARVKSEFARNDFRQLEREAQRARLEGCGRVQSIEKTRSVQRQCCLRVMPALPQTKTALRPGHAALRQDIARASPSALTGSAVAAEPNVCNGSRPIRLRLRLAAALSPRKSSNCSSLLSSSSSTSRPAASPEIGFAVGAERAMRCSEKYSGSTRQSFQHQEWIFQVYRRPASR